MPRARFSNPDDLQLLDSPSWSRCEALILAFEQAWRDGKSPAILDYLLINEPVRRGLLLELVHVDLEFRIKAGELVRVERYLAAHPELLTDPRTIPGLLAAEYELREMHEGSVKLSEYRARFPEQYDDLVERLPLAAGGDTLIPAPRLRTPRQVSPPTVPGYEILEELGRGGMGVIYKARQTSLGRLVALKFLPSDYARERDRLNRFQREAQMASELNHPHICTVHDLGEHENRPFIVMELIEGHTLQALLKTRPAVEEVARVLAEAARALAAAHAAGVVHRDVKPDNIMVRPDGYVKVLDFGLARQLPTLARPNIGNEADTDPGAILGTPAYMSPEQARGQPAESASDVFSLGIVLYELTTGQHPFAADSSLGLLHAITTRQPVPPSRLNPELPATLDRLVEAMLSKEARWRPSAAEVEEALRGLAVRRPSASVAPQPTRSVVPREPELAALRSAFAAAKAGRGSMVCIAGEPGIGKTTLVEDFLSEIAGLESGCLIARGHCSERLANTEAYQPVLEALGGLVRGEAGDTMTRLMRVVAPTWYCHVMPQDVGDCATECSPRGAPSRQAMLREFDHLLQDASRHGPIVLFFDDVHWADVSTVDLLAYLGHRPVGTRVLVVVTYRLTELLLGPHPFYRVKLDLLGKGTCSEWRLGFFHRQDIDRYLTLAFPGHAFSSAFADLIYARTEGNPLFMVHLLRDLRERGALAEVAGRWTLTQDLLPLSHELPGSVRGIIGRKMDRLDELDRRLLSAAAVQGPAFDSAVVAGALGLDAADVEERLQGLDRVHGLVTLLREHEFPDRTLSLRYAFVHVLYQQALYQDLTPSRRSALGVALARTLEGHHGPDNASAAGELACLYEVGRDFGQAARQFWLASQNAARVFAHRESVVLARRGLKLLQALPESAGRASLELPLLTTVGLQLQVCDGYAAPGAMQAYVVARDLYPLAADSLPPFPVLWGLWLYHKVRSELPRAGEFAVELEALARRRQDPDLALQAQQALGMTAFCRGDQVATLRHVEQATALYDPRRHRTHAFLFGQDPGVICKAYGAVALWLLGYPDQAARQSAEAIEMSRELSPTSQAVALHFATMVSQLRRDVARTRELAQAAGALATEHGFAFWLAGAAVLGGWALAASGDVEEGAARLRQGLRDWEATGSVTYVTYYLALKAEVLGWQGRGDEARGVLDEAIALVRRTDERLCEPELYRLRGELTGQKAELERAVEVARQMEARSLELRAAMSLVKLERGDDGARERLAEVVGWFTEGFATADLLEARKLL